MEGRNNIKREQENKGCKDEHCKEKDGHYKDKREQKSKILKKVKESKTGGKQEKKYIEMLLKQREKQQPRKTEI